MKRTGPTNIQLRKLIVELRKLSTKEQSKLWRRAADDLSKTTRSRREVSVGKISDCAKPGETVLVPGKVLSNGELSHKLTVAAFKFSKQAAEKINANGKAITIEELIAQNPKGKKVRILG